MTIYRLLTINEEQTHSLLDKLKAYNAKHPQYNEDGRILIFGLSF